MFKTNLLLAYRSLMKEKGFTLINTIGLALGLACFILIMVYVIHEKSYEKFRPDHERIYRLYQQGNLNSNTEVRNEGYHPYPLQEYILKNYPEVETVISLDYMGGFVITYKNNYFQEWRTLVADSNFFQMFPEEFIIGNSKTALKDAHKVVLTETSAKKWFGNENPMGKLIKVGSDTVMYEVTGIIKDPRTDTHLKYTMLLSDKSFEIGENDTWLKCRRRMVYLKLKPNASPKLIEDKLQSIFLEKMAPEYEKLTGKSVKEVFGNNKMPSYHLQKLDNIYLDNILNFEIGTPGNKALISIASIVAFAILLLACINFINLSTARFSNRMKEICVKKTVGSSRFSLFIQFLGESYLLTFIAIIIALAIVELTIKPFCNTVQLEYIISFYKIPYFFPFIILLFFLVGLFSGTYPAFIMSSANIIDGLRGKFMSSNKGTILRKSLVILQFCISFIILLGALVISNQLSFIREDNKGYTRKNIVILHNTTDIKKENRKTFKDEILKIPGVISATYNNLYPTEFTPNINVWDEDDSSKTAHNIIYSASDCDYLKTMKLTLLKGRYFDKDIEKDSLNILLNETAVKKLGFKNPIGKRLITHTGNPNNPDLTFTVIGVIKDFNLEPVQKEIRQMMFSTRSEQFYYMLVKFDEGRKQEAIKKIHKLWKNLSNGNNLFSEEMQESLDWQYRNVITTTKIIESFSIICIIIACLGLIGLVSYSTLRRTKEIGIRKANGAQVWQILFTLSKDTIILLGIAIVIALPIGTFLMNAWLSQFAYHVNLSVGIVLIAIVSLYTIALLSEVALTLKAARQNPVKALRYE